MTEGHNEGIRVKPRHYDYLKFSLCSLTKPLEYGTISITLVRALWSFSGYLTKTDFLKHSIFESSRRLFESNCNHLILYFRKKAKTAQTNDLDISGVHGPLKDKIVISWEVRYPSHHELNYWEFHTPPALGSFFFISSPQARSSDS